jgi:hypothetical protein
MRSTIVVLLAASACLVALDTAASAPAPAADVKLPHLKSGLWDMSVEMSHDGKSGRPGMAMPKIQICIDPTYDVNRTWRDRMTRSSAAASSSSEPDCTDQSILRRPDGAIAVHATCTSKTGQSTTMDAVISGDFTTTYKVDATVTDSSRTRRMVMTQTRVGDCAPGQKGGSMTINGMTIPSH